MFINDILGCTDVDRIIMHQVEDDLGVACSTSKESQRKTDFNI
jgi:hypothetical protein